MVSKWVGKGIGKKTYSWVRQTVVHRGGRRLGIVFLCRLRRCGSFGCCLFFLLLATLARRKQLLRRFLLFAVFIILILVLILIIPLVVLVIFVVRFLYTRD